MYAGISGWMDGWMDDRYTYKQFYLFVYLSIIYLFVCIAWTAWLIDWLTLSLAVAVVKLTEPATATFFPLPSISSVYAGGIASIPTGRHDERKKVITFQSSQAHTYVCTYKEGIWHDNKKEIQEKKRRRGYFHFVYRVFTCQSNQPNQSINCTEKKRVGEKDEFDVSMKWYSLY